MNQSIVELLRAARVVPVIDLADPADAPALATALLAGGATIAEMTLRGPRALEALASMTAAVAQLGERGKSLTVIAGSVLNADDFEAAIAAGAVCVVSPGSTPALRAHARQRNVPFIPGVATPSEAMAAVDDGFDVLKFFPAGPSGGAPAVRSLLAPLARKNIVLMPTGGIGAADVSDYLSIDGVGAVGGSWMVSPRLLAERRWEEVTALTADAVRG